MAGGKASIETFANAGLPAGLKEFGDALGPDEGRGCRVDHLGIAVESIARARGFYELLGLQVAAIEDVPHEGVRTAMLAVGESRIELLEPLGAESVIQKFLSRRGEGLHHVAFRVPELAATFARLQAAGIRLVSPKIQVGAGGHHYFFVHPASAGGVLVEIVGENPAAAETAELAGLSG